MASAKPELWKLDKAAAEVDRHVLTLRRWIKLDLIRAYRSAPGAPRATFVDMREIRALMDGSKPAALPPKAR